MCKLNCVQDTILTGLYGFETSHSQADERLNRLEAVPETPFPQTLLSIPLPVDSFSICPVASAAIPVYSGYSTNEPLVTAFVPLLPPPNCVDDGSVPVIHALETDIDALRKVI